MSPRQSATRLVRAVVLVWLGVGPLTPAGAAIIHLVIGCITEDGTNRRGRENRWLYNGDRMQELFEDNVARNELTVTRIATSPMTAAAVVRQVQALQGVQPDDALVFYYAGHGAYDQQNRQYFHLLPSRSPLYRQTLYAALARHNPRLLVLISDCCYTYSESREGPPTLGFGQPPPPDGTATRTLFQALFFKTRGVVDITSAGRDQSSYWVGDLTRGSIFGFSLRGVLADFRDQELTWGQVVARVRKRTAAEYQLKIKTPQTVRLADGREVLQTTQTPYAFALPGPRIGIRASVAAGVEGLRIDETLGPAHEAGIKAGDVLQAVNGQPVRSEDELYDAVLESAANSFDVQITDGRTGESKKVTLRPR